MLPLAEEKYWLLKFPIQNRKWTILSIKTNGAIDIFIIRTPSDHFNDLVNWVGKMRWKQELNLNRIPWRRELNNEPTVQRISFNTSLWPYCSWNAGIIKWRSELLGVIASVSINWKLMNFINLLSTSQSFAIHLSQLCSRWFPNSCANVYFYFYYF